MEIFSRVLCSIVINIGAVSTVNKDALEQYARYNIPENTSMGTALIAVDSCDGFDYDTIF